MLKSSLYVLILALMFPAIAPAQANMTQKLEQSCLGACHGANLIAQQRLDRNGWTREMDKMIRWGAVVAAEDKEPLINYLTNLFNSSRPRPNTSNTVPEGKGKDVFQISCMSCHDDRVIAALRLDRAGWTREVDKMINWGAYVPTNRKEELIEYLMTHFGR